MPLVVSDVVSDVVADVVAAAGKLRADDGLVTSAERQLAELEAIFDTITVLESVAVRRLRDACNSDATSQVHGRSTKAWLVEDELMAGPRAGRMMRLLHALPQHPVTAAAYDGGEISTDHAAAILTALAKLPCNVRETVEPHLVDRARHYPPEEIAGFVDELLTRLGLDATADARRERRHAERGFDLTKTFDDTRAVSGSLTPDVADAVEKALDLAGGKSGDEDDRTRRQRWHDALGVIANAFLAQAGTPSFSGAPRTVLVTVDLDTLESQLRDQLITLPSGARISAATARRLACDAAIIPVVLGSNGEVLDIGQADHEFTTGIRRAAYVRDGGRCAFPNCGNNNLELHHITFRRHGGPTSLDNAAWLCTYHHWLVHEGGWTLQRQTDRSYLWTSPHGRQRVRHLSTAPPSP